MNPSIHVAIDHRIDEHLRAERLYYSKRSRFAKADRVVAIILLMVGIGGVAVVGFRWWTVIWFVLAPLEFFNKLSIAPLVLKYRFKRNPKFGETNNIDFSDEGIHFNTSSIDSKLKWDLYDGLLEDEELFLLTYGGQMYTVIPKRCFTEPEMADAFRNLVRSKVQGAQKS